MTTGFTNGCFDVVHIGHLKLFEHLKKQTDYVIVGIDSDHMVKKSKGDERPINNEKDRKFFLEKIDHRPLIPKCTCTTCPPSKNANRFFPTGTIFSYFLPDINLASLSKRLLGLLAFNLFPTNFLV